MSDRSKQVLKWTVQMSNTRSDQTRQTLVDAALETLRMRGYAEASARTIAATASLNQALIFYHFGTVDDLLVAALSKSSRERLARYEERLGEATTLPDLMRTARDLYREDVSSGHVKVLAELVAAGSASPELGAKVAQHVQPWLTFTRATLDRLLVGSPLAALVRSDDAAFGLAALYLGMELLTNLSGDTAQADALFDSAERVASVLSGFIQPRGS